MSPRERQAALSACAVIFVYNKLYDNNIFSVYDFDLNHVYTHV